MASIEEIERVELDSGMVSSEVRSPDTKPFMIEHEVDDDDEEDETLGERLYGLTEMFPESVRNFSYNTGVYTKKCIKELYSLSCSLTWIVSSSAAIMFMPLLFEIERAQLEDMQRNQQKQVLLGPNSAMAGSQLTPQMPMSPPMPR